MTSERILVRTPQWLGDAVVSTVFLSRLRAQQPQAHIAVAAAAGLAPIFASHPAVNETIALPYPNGNVGDAAKLLATAHCDTAYILPRSFRAALESRLAKISKRIGYAGDLRRWLLTNAVSYDHKLVYAHRYLKLIGEETFPLENVAPYFPSQAPSLEKQGPLAQASSGPVLGIAPISVAPSRTWSAERFAQTANDFLKKNGGTVVLFGSAGERSRIEAIATQITAGPVVNTAGQLSLAELGWFISRCRLFLANDSGLMHVAACFRVPAVILFGASEPAFALPPWGTFVGLQHKEIFCVPCLKNNCVRFGSGRDECMRAISVNEAFAALDALGNKP
jgi:heptosyltransferase-2